MKNELIKNHIITPALQVINSYSDDRADMVFVTGAAETLYKDIKQYNGDARSWFQVERKTHDDIYRFLGQTSKQHILDGLIRLANGNINFKEVEVNPFYAAAICAIRYMYDRKPLPEAGFRTAQADYWKRIYNTEQGKGTIGGFLERVTAVTSGS